MAEIFWEILQNRSEILLEEKQENSAAEDRSVTSEMMDYFTGILSKYGTDSIFSSRWRSVKT